MCTDTNVCTSTTMRTGTDILTKNSLFGKNLNIYPITNTVNKTKITI